jgi:hypothetical protein
MNKFLTSKTFLALEHAGKVAAFWAVSDFISQAINQVTHSTVLSPTEVMVVNLILAGILKWVNLKKTEAVLEPEVKTEV